MTIDERIEKLEFVTAAHIEQARQDYEENRRLHREQQADIAAIWKAMERRDQELKQQWKETDERFREMHKDADERGRALDERVDKLVTAIGELCRRLDGGR